MKTKLFTNSNYLLWESEKHIMINLQKKEIKFAGNLEIELLNVIHFLPLVM